MRGTNAKEGIEILTDSDLDITVVTDLAGAADVLQQKLLELERSN
jgi:succinyl-CoA synthetase beta subunit